MSEMSDEIERLKRVTEEALRAPWKHKSRRKCSFKNSVNHATIDVYPDGVTIDADPGYSYNSIDLTLKDLRKIKECILL